MGGVWWCFGVLALSFLRFANLTGFDTLNSFCWCLMMFAVCCVCCGVCMSTRAAAKLYTASSLFVCMLLVATTTTWGNVEMLDQNSAHENIWKLSKDNLVFASTFPHEVATCLMFGSVSSISIDETLTFSPMYNKTNSVCHSDPSVCLGY